MRPLRILMLHNRYAALGGEDVSARAEVEMLREGGHAVDLWETANEEIGPGRLVCTALGAVWSPRSARELAARLSAKRYDLMHVQNFFPLFSPVVHRVARRHGVPSIQHLRNFRFTCADATLFRNGATCRDCVGSFLPWRGVARGCYRGSRAASAAVAAMVGTHKAAGTWSRDVGRYIAVSRHVKDVHVLSGLAPERISVRPNVVRVEGEPFAGARRNVLVAARLVPEKGVQTAIAAWKRAALPGETLRIAGSGPMERELRALAGSDASIVFLGQISAGAVIGEMRRAKLVVVPSLWAEPFGRTALEAMAAGTPAVASEAGGLPEVIGREGGLFEPGNATRLAAVLGSLLSCEASWEALRSRQAERYRREFETDAVWRETMAIYAQVIGSARR